LPNQYVITDEDRRQAAERLAREEARRAGLPLPKRPPVYATAPYPEWLARTIASIKRRTADARYDRSEKGKARAARYNATRKGRDRYIEYYYSPKGVDRNFRRYMRELNARCESHRARLTQIEALVGPDFVAGVLGADTATVAQVDALLGIR
jgi:hypothetical protein